MVGREQERRMMSYKKKKTSYTLYENTTKEAHENKNTRNKK